VIRLVKKNHDSLRKAWQGLLKQAVMGLLGTAGWFILGLLSGQRDLRLGGRPDAANLIGLSEPIVLFSALKQSRAQVVCAPGCVHPCAENVAVITLGRSQTDAGVGVPEIRDGQLHRANTRIIRFVVLSTNVQQSSEPVDGFLKGLALRFRVTVRSGICQVEAVGHFQGEDQALDRPPRMGGNRLVQIEPELRPTDLAEVLGKCQPFPGSPFLGACVASGFGQADPGLEKRTLDEGPFLERYFDLLLGRHPIDLLLQRLQPAGQLFQGAYVRIRILFERSACQLPFRGN